MGNVSAYDAEKCLDQLLSCARQGCDIFRLALPDMEAVKTFAQVRRQSTIPIVADIHFDYRLALAALEAGADALRINPGNIGGRDKVQAVARAAKAKGVPIRIGVNSGSLEKGETLVSSALKHIRLLEDEGFFDIAVSVKSSNVAVMVDAYRELAQKTDCPLHLGLTEAGTSLPGTVRSSVALGILLSEGIGDTIRVSLTDRPEKEVKVGLEILRSLSLRDAGPSIISCPTCARTKVNLFETAAAVVEALEGWAFANPGCKIPKVAVMGCVVNGPGEAKDADIALCGGDGDFLLYVKGSQVCKVGAREALGKVMEYVVSL
jgi:(E)-4-hydroxy-3-methylbut-2-enyl-diphosphate synthase